MTKKLFFLAGLVCPLLLFGAPPCRVMHQEGTSTRNSDFSKKERALVTKVWSILKNTRNAKALHEILSSNFRYINVDAMTANKKQFIHNVLHLPTIIDFRIEDLVLKQSGHTIIATYLLWLKTSLIPEFMPSAQMFVFRKEKGLWKVQAMSNLDVFNSLEQG